MLLLKNVEVIAYVENINTNIKLSQKLYDGFPLSLRLGRGNFVNERGGNTREHKQYSLLQNSTLSLSTYLTSNFKRKYQNTITFFHGN